MYGSVQTLYGMYNCVKKFLGHVWECTWLVWDVTSCSRVCKACIGVYMAGTGCNIVFKSFWGMYGIAWLIRDVTLCSVVSSACMGLCMAGTGCNIVSKSL